MIFAKRLDSDFLSKGFFWGVLEWKQPKQSDIVRSTSFFMTKALLHYPCNCMGEAMRIRCFHTLCRPMRRFFLPRRKHQIIAAEVCFKDPHGASVCHDETSGYAASTSVPPRFPPSVHPISAGAARCSSSWCVRWVRSGQDLRSP